MKWQGPVSFKSAYFSYHSSTLEGGEQAVSACPVITDCSWGSVWWLSKEECDAVWVSANTCQSSSSSGMSHSHTLVSSEYWLMAEYPSLKWLINKKIIPHPPVVFSWVDGLYLLPWEFCQASDRTLYNCTSLGEGYVLPSRKEIQPSVPVHSASVLQCDNCGVEPIQGVRWHCQDCPPEMSLDFCDSCSDW